MVPEVLIPAAGRGERLDRPNTPKPLVDVGGEPLIVGVLRQLDNAGVERAHVVVGYEGDQIVRALTNHPGLGIDVEFIENPGWRKGLASSILAAKDLFDEPFAIAMADHRFDQELVDRIVEFELGGEAGAMIVDRDLDSVHDPKDAVDVRINGDEVVDIARRLDDPNGVDAGLFLLRPQVFDSLEKVLTEKEPAGLSDGIAKLLEDHEVRAVFANGASWHDVDTPAALIRAEMGHRDRLRKEAVTQPEFANGEAEAKTTSYQFTTGKPVDTDVHVQRGFVRNPNRLELIPEESASSPIYVFTDTRVNSIYGDDFVGGLDEMGYDVRRIVMAEGEESKTMQNYTEMVDHVLAEGIDERSVLVSLGGGAVCNVCGFVASTLYRGIGLVHVPTTLMAQCDAAIGHKQGINGSRGKNMVGAYYPPHAIAVDVEVLATLEDWLIPDGLSEVIKHALGQDREYLEFLLDYNGAIDDPDFLEKVVCKNIELKCELMASDPKELREGMVLQYGHTTGHPIEYLSGYDLNHGQCVGIGMMIASRVGRLLGACDEEMVELHREVIEKYELPTTIPDSIDVDDIMTALQYNKRFLTEGTRMAIVESPGELWKVDGDYTIPVPEEVLKEALHLSY